jgi:hypothetical protein
VIPYIGPKEPFVQLAQLQYGQLMQLQYVQYTQFQYAVVDGIVPGHQVLRLSAGPSWLRCALPRSFGAIVTQGEDRADLSEFTARSQF